MIVPLDDAQISGTLHRLQLAIRAGCPAASIFVLPDALRFAGRKAGGSGAPMPIASDPDHPESVLEAALQAEWQALVTQPDADLELEIRKLIRVTETSAFLVRSDSRDPLGTVFAAGVFETLQACQDVAASIVFTRALGTAIGTAIGTAPGTAGSHIAVTPIPSGSGTISCYSSSNPGPPGSWAARLAAEWELTTSAWMESERGPVLIGADGPSINPDDRWGLDAAEEIPDTPRSRLSLEDLLRARTLLGRVYNRLLRPADPFGWVSLLSDSTPESLATAFVLACEALEPGSGDRLISLARRSVSAELAGAFQNHLSGSSPAHHELREKQTAPALEMPDAQQLFGLPGGGCEKAGRVHHRHLPPPAGTYVLVCDRFQPEDAPLIDKAVALVERSGSRFGIGSISAMGRSIPHVYGLSDTTMLPEACPVVVNGELGVVSRKA